MKFKGNKTSGFTLIECVAYLSISLIIVSMGLELLLESNGKFYVSIRENLNLNSIEEAFHMIDIIKINDFDEIYVENNKIVFSKHINDKYYEKNKICKVNNNLIVEYYNGINLSTPSTRNIILPNIEKFNIKKKGKLIYLVIEKNGVEYTKCI